MGPRLLTRRRLLPVCILVLCCVQITQAHVQHGEAASFRTGFQHPISGLDHVVAMIAVGLWGAQLGAPAVWLLPVAFPMVMAMGGMLGLMGLPLPGAEIGIAASAILLGLAVMSESRPPLVIAALVVTFFAVFHGHAHGAELPPGRSPLQHGIRDRNWEPARRRDLHRCGPSLAVGAAIAADGRWSGCVGWSLLHVESGVVDMPRQITCLGTTALAILILVAICPVRLEAHLNSTGLGPVYDGALHLLLAPEDLVPSVAVALLAGLRGPRHGRVALFALPTAWFTGGLAGMAAEPASSTPAAVASFVLLGTLIAADLPVPLGVLTALVIVLGLVNGYLNGAGIGPLSVGVQVLLGLAGVLFVLVSLVGAFVVRMRELWARTVVRVLGSWIVATGLLMLAWAVHSARAT